MIRFLRDLKFLLFNKFTLRLKLIGENTDVRLLPKYSKDGDSCLDVCASEDVTIKPKQTQLIPLGISVELPKGYEIQIRNRSGIGSKGLIIPQGLGTVDSGYRGELKACLYNTKSKPFEIKKYDRIAQIVVKRTPIVKIKQVNKINKTERGIDGFGSTGM